MNLNGLTFKQKVIFVISSTIVTGIFFYWVYLGSVWKQERCDRPEVQCNQ